MIVGNKPSRGLVSHGIVVPKILWAPGRGGGGEGHSPDVPNRVYRGARPGAQSLSLEQRPPSLLTTSQQAMTQTQPAPAIEPEGKLETKAKASRKAVDKAAAIQRQLDAVAQMVEEYRTGLEKQHTAAMSEATKMQEGVKKLLQLTAPKKRKRPTSKCGYHLFCDARRGEISESHPEMKQTDIMKELGRMWRDSTEDEKLEYNNEAKRLKAEADKETKAESESIGL